MVKHTQTIRRLLVVNCLSVFDHFVGMAFKGFMAGSYPKVYSEPCQVYVINLSSMNLYHACVFVLGINFAISMGKTRKELQQICEIQM